MSNENMLSRSVPYQGGWLPITYGDELATREQRIRALEVENAAMREIVRAVADSEPETSRDHGLTVMCWYCGGPRDYSGDYSVLGHTRDCISMKARALLASETTAEQGDE